MSMSIETFLNMQIERPNRNLFNRNSVLKKKLVTLKKYLNLKGKFVITYLSIQQFNLWLLTVLQYLKGLRKTFRSYFLRGEQCMNCPRPAVLIRLKIIYT